MQLSVTPHLTIYGDVKPEEVQKKSFIRNHFEQLSSREVDNKNMKRLPGEEKALGTEIRHDIMKPLKPKAELMVASGQVGNQ